MNPTTRFEKFRAADTAGGGKRGRRHRQFFRRSADMLRKGASSSPAAFAIITELSRMDILSYIKELRDTRHLKEVVYSFGDIPENDFFPVLLHFLIGREKNAEACT